MNNLYTDVAYRGLNKNGEQLCGDHVDLTHDADNASILVLADGLGSGVKASILSTLTAKLLSTMLAQGLTLNDCVTTMAATLPVCSVRKVAYSTFTACRITENQDAEMSCFDNPHAILLRDGKNEELPETVTNIDGKNIYRSYFHMNEGDTLIFFSDGAIHAGIGTSMNFGWQREDIIDFLETMYDPGFTAKAWTTLLLDECNKLYAGEPGDDTTVCCVKIRERMPVNLMIGPPANPADVYKMMSLFFAKEGKHIVCGGTTGTLAGEFLKKPVIPSLTYVDPEIPPTATLEGVDLVTEGVITINRVLTYAKSYLTDNACFSEWGYKQDGASKISRMLFEEATDINFYVGRAINPAHQNPDLPINFSIKMHLVDELAKALRQMGKRVIVSYF